MKTRTKEEIAYEVRKSIHVYGGSEQRLRQLAEVLSRRGTPLVGDALMTVWMELVDPDAHFTDQEFVATLLFALNPASSLALDDVLEMLPRWNLSVEQFAFYLALQFGEERLLEELKTTEQAKQHDKVFLRASETVRYWLRWDWRAKRVALLKSLGNRNSARLMAQRTADQSQH